MSLPGTKRFLYDVILKWYEDSIKETRFRTNFCYTFHGVRRIGKTILLRQLNEVISNSKYYDCSAYQDDERDLVEDMDNDLDRGIKVFLLDEICKYPDLSYLISTIKICGHERTFIITGSTSKFVQNIGHRICSGPIVYLPPITYCEWLSWNNNCEYKDVFKYSTIDTFDNYIKSDSLFQMDYEQTYFASVVQDTSKSYKVSMPHSHGLSDMIVDFQEEILEDILTYMSIINLTTTASNGKYSRVLKGVSTDNTSENSDSELIQKIINNCRNKILSYPSHIITEYLHLLEISGLINSYNLIKIDENNIIESLENGYYIFRYPQYVKNLLYYVELKNEYHYNVIENLLLDTISTYYNYAGKYRDKDVEGMDIRYLIDASIYGIEVKCRPIDKINTEHYAYVANTLNLKDICFTTNNLDNPYIKKDNYYVIRHDMLMLLVELEYFNQSPRKMTIPEMISKYLT